MAAPSALTLTCESCGELGPHRVLHGRVGGKDALTFQGTVKCPNCGLVRNVVHSEAKKLEVEVMVSWMNATEPLSVELPEGSEVLVGDHLEVGGGPVEVTAIEIEGRRVPSAAVGEILTLWAKRAEKVRVRVAISRGAKTTSRQIFAAPDEEFTVGEMIDIGKERFVVRRIQLNGRMLTEGSSTAHKIVRLLCAYVRESYR